MYRLAICQKILLDSMQTHRKNQVLVASDLESSVQEYANCARYSSHCSHKIFIHICEMSIAGINGKQQLKSRSTGYLCEWNSNFGRQLYSCSGYPSRLAPSYEQQWHCSICVSFWHQFCRRKIALNSLRKVANPNKTVMYPHCYAVNRIWLVWGLPVLCLQEQDAIQQFRAAIRTLTNQLQSEHKNRPASTDSCSIGDLLLQIRDPLTGKWNQLLTTAQYLFWEALRAYMGQYKTSLAISELPRAFPTIKTWIRTARAECRFGTWEGCVRPFSIRKSMREKLRE